MLKDIQNKKLSQIIVIPKKSMFNNESHQQIEQLGAENMLDQFSNSSKDEKSQNSQDQDSIDEVPQIQNKIFFKSPKSPQSPYHTEENNYLQKQADKQKMNQQFQIKFHLPTIIRGKELFERKETIEIFKSKIVSDYDRNRKKKQKVKSKSGKIHVNEIWSEKYLKLIIQESKIQQNIEKIQKLDRRIVQEYIDDLPVQKIAPLEIPVQKKILKTNKSINILKPLPLQTQYRMKTQEDDKDTKFNWFRDSTKIKEKNKSFNSQFKMKFVNLINECKNYDVESYGDMKTTTQTQSKQYKTQQRFISTSKSKFSQFSVKKQSKI